MRIPCILLAIWFALGIPGNRSCAADPTPQGPYYGVLRDVPIVEISPEGWLAEFLTREKNGLAAHREACGYPFNKPGWGGVLPGKVHWDYYEQNGYLFDGIYRCGLLLHDPGLTDFGATTIHYVLDHPQEDGKLGPGEKEFGKLDGHEIGTTQWPFAVFTRALIVYYQATHDPAIIEGLTRHYLTLPENFGHARDVDNIEGMCWLYGQTGDKRMLDIAERTWGNFAKGPKNQWYLPNLTAANPMKGHGVSVCEATKQPAILYIYTGKKEYLDAVLGGFRALHRDDELADGVITSDEGLRGNAPEVHHETCDISDYTWSLGYVLKASGDPSWADTIEKGVYNAGFGAIDKDFKGLEYFSSPNQVVATRHSSSAKFGPGDADRQAYQPRFAVQCCTGNVHRFLPNFASRLWMENATDGGLTALFYAPSTLHHVVNGVPVVFKETTDYPFAGKIELAFSADKPVAMPLYFRIPGWAAGATVSVNGQTLPPTQAGSFYKVERTFAPGDVIALDLPMRVREEKPVPGGVCLMRGPLLFSLKLQEEATKTTTGVANPDFPIMEYKAASPWNYALHPVLYETDGLAKIAVLPVTDVQVKPITAFPWTPETCPVVIKVNAHRIPSWNLTPDGKNPPLPVAPFEVAKNTEQIELIPDGATHVRLSVFPENP